ncbi:MAG TPA: site-specific integrase [Caldilineae bacterium]|nr:site-specific integrase [Caldilineae bacterium]
MYRLEQGAARGIAHHGRAQRKSREASQRHADIIPWPRQRIRRATPGRAISLKRALDSFFLDAEARQLAPMTLRYYRQQLQPFLAHLRAQGIVNVDQLAADPIRSYLVLLQERKLKANSVHAAARAVRAFSNFLVTEELIKVSPMRNVRMPRLPKEIPPAFQQQDVMRLVAAWTTVRDEAIVLFLVDSGCAK